MVAQKDLVQEAEHQTAALDGAVRTVRLKAFDQAEDAYHKAKASKYVASQGYTYMSSCSPSSRRT